MEGPRFVRCSSVDGRWAAAALGRCERGAVGVAVSCLCESGFSVPWAYTQECSCWVVSWELCVQRFEEPGNFHAGCTVLHPHAAGDSWSLA